MMMERAASRASEGLPAEGADCVRCRPGRLRRVSKCTYTFASPAEHKETSPGNGGRGRGRIPALACSKPLQ